MMRGDAIFNVCAFFVKCQLFRISYGFFCISEALEAFNVNEHKVSREKRSAFNEDEKKIAGVSRQFRFCLFIFNFQNKNIFIDKTIAT